MARAHFRFAIGPRGRAPGSAIRVGDPVTVTVVVRTPKRHTGIELVWKLGWTAKGRRSDARRVAQGRIPIAVIEAEDPQVFRFDTRIPPQGPISYGGSLFTVGWWLEVSLDIPWAFDPDDSIGFRVLPRRELRIAVNQPAPRVSARPAEGEGATCPFCKDEVDDDRWTCPKCSTPHHAECHTLYGRCTIPGCSG